MHRLNGIETAPAHSLALGFGERPPHFTVPASSTISSRTNTFVVGKPNFNSSTRGDNSNVQTAYKDIGNGTESMREQIQQQIQQQLNLPSSVPPGLPTYARPTTVGINYGINGILSSHGNGDALIQKVNSVPNLGADSEENKIVRHHHMSSHVNKYNIPAPKLKTFPTGRASTPEHTSHHSLVDTTPASKHVTADISVDQRGRTGVIAPHPRMRLNSPVGGDRRDSVEPATQPATPHTMSEASVYTNPYVAPPYAAPAKGAGILAWHQYFIECNDMKESPAGGVAVDAKGCVVPQTETVKGMPSPLIGPSSDPSRPTAVLDLDETLIYAREGPIVTRPGAVQFVQNLHKAGYEVVVWTAAMRDHALAVLRIIDPTASIVEHCVYRTEKWWNEWVAQHGSISKNLRLLGRPLEKTLLLENTSDCVRDNPRQSILLSDFEGNMKDDSLFTVGRLLTEYAELRAASANDGELSNDQLLTGSNHTAAARKEIGAFMQSKHELVQRDVPTSSGYLVLFTLKKDTQLGREAANSEYYQGRINRDSPLQLRRASQQYGGGAAADQYLMDEIQVGGGSITNSSVNNSYYQNSMYAGRQQQQQARTTTGATGGLINYDQHYGATATAGGGGGHHNNTTLGSNRMLLIGNAGLYSPKKDSTALARRDDNKRDNNNISMTTLAQLYSR